MKLFNLQFVIVWLALFLHSPLALTEVSCWDDGNNKISDECKGAAAAGAGGVGSGVYAYRKYKQADSVMDRYKLPIRQYSPPRLMDDEEIRRIDGYATRGDQFTIHYELSEPESRKWWISKYQDDIEGATQRARGYLADMDVPVFYTDEKGNLKTRSKNFMEKQMLQMQADAAFREAEEAKRDLARVRNPKNPVQLVPLDKEIESTGVDGNVEKFLKAEAARQSKLISASKVPVQYWKYSKSLRRIGHVATGGAVMGVVGATLLILKEYTRDRDQYYSSPSRYQRYHYDGYEQYGLR